MEEFLINNNFIGRDGFIWWIGQIAPFDESVKLQFTEEAWGNRFKVRIMGYHPYSTTELSNDDLPWALVMQGVSDGSGRANFSKSNKIRPGDVVIGFFLDGNDAQQPVIIGVLGNSDQKALPGFKFPFNSFTGYSEEIRKPDRSVSTANEASDANSTSQQGPVQDTRENATRRGRASAAGASIGLKVVAANTCENTTTSTIESELENLIKKIKDKQAKISELQKDINEAAEVIKSAMSWLVGEIFKEINEFLVGDYTKSPPKPGVIPNALNALYTSVYTATLPAGGPAAANIAGTQALEKMVVPVSALEAALICVQNAILEGLVALIRDLLLSMLDNIEKFATCIVDQFVGSLLNSVVDQIANGLNSALDGVSGLLGGVIDIVSIAQNAIEFYNSLDDLFDCNQINTKCDGTKEWNIGAGPKDIMDIEGSFDNIFNVFNNAAGLANQAINTARDIQGNVEQTIGGVTDTIEGVKSVVPIFNGDSLQEGLQSAFNSCLTTYPSSCGSAKINIFGGGGIGGSAIPIFGPTIERVINDTSIGKNVNKTSSIIGAVIENAGSGYRFPPFVEIVDDCGIGYGAIARSTINDNGEIESIYIVSSGENYPVGEQDIYGVTDTTVIATGIGYEQGDTAEDNLGNQYNLTIDDGRIISATPINIVEARDIVTIRVNSDTGLGAVIKPILGPIPPQEEVIQVIDCIT